MGKREQQPDRKRFAGSVPLRWIAMAVCVIVMICCGVYLVRLAVESHTIKEETQGAAEQYVQPIPSADTTDPAAESSSEEGNASPVTVDFASLQTACPDAVGWIQVSGIDAINYPVVHYTDDSYYLNHSWDGQSSRYGAIFVETANSGDFNDCHTLIYGHNMKDGSMFGGLKKYRDPSFYEEHGGMITLCLPGETRMYQIFSVHIAEADDEGVYTIGFAHDEGFGSFLEALKQRSIYDTGVSVSAQDNVITLSTCSGEERLVIHAKQISSIPTA